MKFLVHVDATDWCGYSEYYEIEAASEADIDEDKYIQDYAESMSLVQCEGGWTDFENCEWGGELIDEDDVTSFTVTIRELSEDE